MEYFHEDAVPILKDAYGIIYFQEHVMSITSVSECGLDVCQSGWCSLTYSWMACSRSIIVCNIPLLC